MERYQWGVSEIIASNGRSYRTGDGTQPPQGYMSDDMLMQNPNDNNQYMARSCNAGILIRVSCADNQ